MYRSVILPLAKQDIQCAAQWYNSKKKGLGRQFTSEVRRKIHFIQQNPKAISIRYNKVRVLALDVFPYLIHYTIDESTQTIPIIAILHTSRNPKLWKNR